MMSKGLYHCSRCHAHFYDHTATQQHINDKHGGKGEVKRHPTKKELIIWNEQLRAQLAAAEADKLAFGDRVRKKAISLIDLLSLGRSHSAHKAMVQAIRALDLDALAEGEK